MESSDTTQELPEIDFTTFVVSLATSVQMHLGLIQDPTSAKKGEKVKPNLDHAKQTIDILGMLQEKTSGNLNKQEEELLKNLLYDLRITFVEQKKNLGK